MTAVTRNVQFRRAAGRFPTGVAVVGTLADAEPHAMTVNSFVTVSLDPLLVLVSVDLTSRTYQRIRSGSGFAVTVLSAAQQDIAGWFASRRRAVGAAAFAGIDWHPAPCSAAPVLKGGISYFDCTVAEIRIAGDHALVIGAVEAFDILSEEPPLMFLDSSYITVGAR